MLEPILRRAAREFPALVLTGPRQSGKTTVLQRLFGQTHGYVSVEPPDVRAAAAADPHGFLATHVPPVILDEVHFAPALLIYIKEWIGTQRTRRGQYLLTGSQNLLLSERNESAGEYATGVPMAWWPPESEIRVPPPCETVDFLETRPSRRRHKDGGSSGQTVGSWWFFKEHFRSPYLAVKRAQGDRHQGSKPPVPSIAAAATGACG